MRSNILLGMLLVLGLAMGCGDDETSAAEDDFDPDDPYAQQAEEHTVLGINVTADTSVGPGSSNQYDPGAENSEGVITDDQGRLIINGDLSSERNDLWVANAKEGTVSNVHTELLVEAGRYHVGTDSDANPSRTSVDLAGDMFVGNRDDRSVTKIASNPARCIDRNRNGVIDTSTGPEPLPRADGDQGESTDECVLWTHQFDEESDLPAGSNEYCDGPRAIAATPERGDDFEYNGHVWVGCRNSHTIHKLNGDTGEVLVSYGPFDGSDDTMDVAPYGFVLDSEEQLWIAGRGGGGTDGVYWMNTATGEMHDVSAGGPDAYGIALDGHGDIWVATTSGTIGRYTGPEEDETEGTWEELSVTDKFKGIAVDVDGYVWAIDNGGDADIWFIDPETFPHEDSIHSILLGDYSNNSAETGMGVAIDFSGHVWGVAKSGCGDNGCAFRFEVDRSQDGVPVISNVSDVIPVGEDPYSYSDMIGYSLRNFASIEGWYRQTFQACPDSSTRWNQIGFLASLPAGTKFIIRARTADHEDDLVSASFLTVVTVSPDNSPVDLPAELPEGRFIELEVHLYAQLSGISPALGTIGFDYVCTTPVAD